MMMNKYELLVEQLFFLKEEMLEILEQQKQEKTKELSKDKRISNKKIEEQINTILFFKDWIYSDAYIKLEKCVSNDKFKNLDKRVVELLHKSWEILEYLITNEEFEIF